jgi:hypothetical protein
LPVLGVVVMGVGVAFGITLSVPPVSGPLLPAVIRPLASALAAAGNVLSSVLLPELAIAGVEAGTVALVSVGAAAPGMTTVAAAGTGSSLALSQPTVATSAPMLASRTRARRRRRAKRFTVILGLGICLRQAVCPRRVDCHRRRAAALAPQHGW